MPFTDQPPPKPPNDVPFVDPKTGAISETWAQWLVRLIEWMKRMGAAIP